MTIKTMSASMTWPEVRDAMQRGAAALLPLASTEEHGLHAPTGDYRATEAMTLRVAKVTGDVVFPCLPFGYSEYFRHYPGTITLQAETLHRVVADILNCLIDHGFSHIVLVNGHKGNEPTLMHVQRQIRRQRGLLIPAISPLSFVIDSDFIKEVYGTTTGVIGHGGEPTASIASFLFPDSVDMSQIEDWGTLEFRGQRPNSLNGVWFDGVPISLPIDMEDICAPSGSLSDPRLASPERGQLLVERAVDRMARFVTWFKTIDSRVEAN